jgi:hypothetical protein
MAVFVTAQLRPIAPPGQQFMLDAIVVTHETRLRFVYGPSRTACRHRPRVAGIARQAW